MPNSHFHKIVKAIAQLTYYLSHDFLGGPKHLKFAHVINFQKGLTGLWVLGLMVYFQNYSIQSWIYLALHGSYGVCWLIKDLAFPDQNWQKKVTYGGALLAITFVLGPYWLFSFILISPTLLPDITGASLPWLAVAIATHTIGLSVMMAADAQKYFVLETKKELITNGMFKHIRHPNYLGEIMIYGSYAVIVWHWLPWVILFSIWTLIFGVNIVMKEQSMARYDKWKEYKTRSGLLLPKFF
ncbi:MAG: DUF1295 domain-containing protein [Gammaproteobacteria bacterium]|nr:DUF1295 domain-containing protein [Gammaproteobacteria bacterium]